MFLDFEEFTTLVKLPVVSPASRNVNKFINEFCLQSRFKHLSIYKKWQAGKSSQGKTIFWTRSSLLKKTKTLTINYNIRNVKLCFIASFQFLSSNKKMASLVYFANGAVTYYLTTENHTLFSYGYLNWNKNLRKFFYDPYWSPIVFLKKLIYISFIEILPGKKAQYCLSSGTQSRILNIDKKTHAVLIQLPSKVKKIISYYSCVFLGRLALIEKKRYHNTRSGYWRSLGKKPIVRGVAMNPVDHPHGGRGKSIRYPQTPWGKTTKFK